MFVDNIFVYFYDFTIRQFWQRHMFLGRLKSQCPISPFVRSFVHIVTTISHEWLEIFDKTDQ